ncbi:hypothetical protein D3C80_1640400 [compost metagenome]
MFLPDDVIVGGKVLALVAAKIRMPMVPASIADRVQVRDAQPSGQALQRFEYQAARAQAFEVLGQVAVDGQRGFAVDAFVDALHGADEQVQLTLAAAQGERQ